MVTVLTLIVLAPVLAVVGYSASKATAQSMTQRSAAELAPRGIHVLGAYPGGIDTDMLAGAGRIVAALVAEQAVVFPDDAAAVGEVYLSDPARLKALLAGRIVVEVGLPSAEAAAVAAALGPGDDLCRQSYGDLAPTRDGRSRWPCVPRA